MQSTLVNCYYHEPKHIAYDVIEFEKSGMWFNELLVLLTDC